VPIDNTMPEHRKIAGAGHARDVVRLFAWQVAAICFADRLATDGRITTDDLPNLIPAAGPPTPRDIRLLVERGLWETVAPGVYNVHDFTVYNERAESRRRSRDASKQRMRELRARVAAKSADRVSQSTPPQPREAQSSTPLTSPGSAEATESEPSSLSLVKNSDIPNSTSQLSAEDARRLIETRERLRRQRRANAIGRGDREDG
jgi:hypothetical protein